MTGRTNRRLHGRAKEGQYAVSEQLHAAICCTRAEEVADVSVLCACLRCVVLSECLHAATRS